MAPSHKTSGSEQGSPPEVDSKKQKRMLSNRESARRSRMRKQQHIDGLLGQVTKLQNDYQQILMQINMLNQKYSLVESDNTLLRTHVMDLTERLRSLNSVLSFVSEFSGMHMDIPEIPDPLLNPWQLPCPSQPIIASADIFLC